MFERIFNFMFDRKESKVKTITIQNKREIQVDPMLKLSRLQGLNRYERKIAEISCDRANRVNYTI